MNKSDSIKELAAALCKVQAELRGFKEDSTNPFFNSKYGDLTSVWAAIRKPLTDNGLSVVQTIDHCDPMQALPEMINKRGEVLPHPGDPVTIETTLLHSSGEWISGRLEIRADKPGPQAIGIAITYGRRYSLAAIVGVAPEDDDGEGATNHDKQRALPPASRQDKQAAAGKKADETSKPKQTTYRDNPGWTVVDGFEQSGSDMVSIVAEYKKETAKSILFAINGKDVFMPKSNVDQYSATHVHCTEWIAYKKVEAGDIPERLIVRIGEEQNTPDHAGEYDETNPPPFTDEDIPF
jgi:hypothetical protein